jgi:LmbE family N-acetylglucosaminyl deacetylase
MKSPAVPLKIPLRQKLIISPHLDDAWFDLGGSINEWRKTGNEVKVVDVFSVQGWMKQSVLPVAQVTQIRKCEETANARRDGVTLKFLDLKEARLREYELIFPPEIDWSIDRSTLDSMVAGLQDVAECLQAGDAVYFPLGIGGHVDHLLVREAFTILRASVLSRSVEVEFYEDLPYATYHKLPLNFISQHGLSPVLQQVEIEHKIIAVRAYKSQVDDGIVAAIRNYACALGGDGKAYERRWRLN